MSFSLATLPLAAGAGALGLLSPCVWPLVPVVMSSATVGGRSGPWWLTAGHSLSFALAGTLLSFALVSLGLDPELFRKLSGLMLLAVAAVMLIPRLGEWLTLGLSRLTGRLNPGSGNASTGAGQFSVGLLLGLIWLPCVGPTLGAAIALASMGQELLPAFLVMLAYGLGTGAVLLGAGFASRSVLLKLRPSLLNGAARGKQLLAWTLALLGTLVMTGGDKLLETWAAGWLPDWALSL